MTGLPASWKRLAVAVTVVGVSAATFVNFGPLAAPPSSGWNTPPAAPAGLSAQATQTTLTLSWRAGTGPGLVFGYEVYLDSKLVARTQTNTLTYTFTGLACGTQHVLGVDAFNLRGRSSVSSISATTSSCVGSPGSPPPPPSPPPPSPPPPSPPPPPSNGSTLYVSPSGSDSGLCTQAAPCLTFEWAYQVASPGSTVLVTCGGASACSYPTQYLRQRYAKPAGSVCRWAETFKDGATAQNLSGCVTFKPAAGVTPTITGGIDISVPYVLIDGLRTGLDPAGGNGGILVGLDNSIGGADCTSLQSHDIILKNTVTNILTVDGAHYLYLVGGSYGPYNDHSSNIEPCLDGAGNHFNTDHVAIDGATFHDYYVVTAGAHDECIHWQDTSQGILRNSRFLNCGQQDVSFQTRNFGYTHLRAFTIENNYFDGACSHQPAPCGVVSGGTTTLICSGSDLTAEDLQDFTIRFNSYASAGAPSFQTYGGCGANITMTGNIVSGPWSTLSCTNDQTAGVTYLDNLFFNNIPCGTGNLLNTNPATTYTNENAYDWTLKTGATAIDAIPPGITYPTTDITGTPRPQHAAPDAGATEHS